VSPVKTKDISEFPVMQWEGKQMHLIDPLELQHLLDTAKKAQDSIPTLELALERLQRFQSKGYLAGHDRAIAGLIQAIEKNKLSHGL